MKKARSALAPSLLALALVLLLAACSSACSSTADDASSAPRKTSTPNEAPMIDDPADPPPKPRTPAELPAKIELRVDEPIDLADGMIHIELLEILRDSRCPVDVQCIRAGEAEVSIGLRAGDATETVSLGTPSDMTETRAEALGHVLELVDVLPRPVSTEQLEEEDYRVIVRVTEAPAM